MIVVSSLSSSGAIVSPPVVANGWPWSVIEGSLWSSVVMDGMLWSMENNEWSPSGIWSRDAAGFVGECRISATQNI